jgi:MGT family glycosyltransferase
MRILFTSRGSAGHVGPLAPYARAAARAGHDVLVAAQPRYAANVARLGLPFAPTGDPDPREWGPLMARLPTVGFREANEAMVGEFFGRIDTEAALPELRRLVRSWRPDLIVRESWEYASTIVASLFDLPIARVALGTVEMEELSIRLAAPAVSRLRESVGLEPDASGDLMHGTPFLSVLPRALEDPAIPEPGITHRFGQAIAADTAPLPSWWPPEHDGDPLVYLTFGSVTAGEHMPFFPALYRAAIDALADLPIRMLLTIGEPRDLSALGPVPANVHVEHWVDQERALASAAVAVTHGGHGTTVGALRHGVPQVVLPLFSVDQWANATAVARAGAGVAVGSEDPDRLLFHTPGPPELAEVADAVRALLGNSDHRRAALALAADMQALLPVDAAVELLSEVLAQPARGVARSSAPWTGSHRPAMVSPSTLGRRLRIPSDVPSLKRERLGNQA